HDQERRRAGDADVHCPRNGRQRRDSDIGGDRARAGAGRSDLGKWPASVAQRAFRRIRQWVGERAGRGRRRLGLVRLRFENVVDWRHHCPGDDPQSGDRGNLRHGYSADPKKTESGSCTGFDCLCYDLHGRRRIPIVPGTGDVVDQVFEIGVRRAVHLRGEDMDGLTLKAALAIGVVVLIGLLWLVWKFFSKLFKHVLIMLLIGGAGSAFYFYRSLPPPPPEYVGKYAYMKETGAYIGVVE